MHHRRACITSARASRSSSRRGRRRIEIEESPRAPADRAYLAPAGLIRYNCVVSIEMCFMIHRRLRLPFDKFCGGNGRQTAYGSLQQKDASWSRQGYKLAWLKRPRQARDPSEVAVRVEEAGSARGGSCMLLIS